MAETWTRRASEALAVDSDNMSRYSDCVSFLLKQVGDFGQELKLGDAALRVEVDMDALRLQPSSAAHVYTCLQKHVANLQVVSENLKSLMEAQSRERTSKEEEDASHKVPSSSSLPDQTRCERGAPRGRAASEDDDVMVQIKAGKSEIERRISAFMERKQMEINENNVREFCNVIDCNQENSCARTDAVFTPYPGFKSHVKVSRVVNTYGPQTRGGAVEPGEQQKSSNRSCGNGAIEERLQNIETHLKLPAAGPVPQNVYQRLKRLEDRILELEGLSPEYFQSTGRLHKRPKTSLTQDCNLTELDEKISAVKAALLKKVNEYRPGCESEFHL